MQVSDFDFELPEQHIAHYPTDVRSASRLLIVPESPQQTLKDQHFHQLDDYLAAGDLLVMNDTRVIPARLFAHKASGGKLEILVERILSEHQVLAHIKASKAPKPDTQIILGDVTFTLLERQDSLFLLQLPPSHSIFDVLAEHGHMPLPPYIKRADQPIDQQRYQTVYHHPDKPGAVAAPTAGLHFDEPLLERLRAKGVNTASITLHVGAGTFQPVRVDTLEDHVMHAEYLEVPQQTVECIQRTQQQGGRIVAVGTTVVRALETAAQAGGLQPFRGESRIFIYPGFQFQVVDRLITNFHLPKSTLLMLVSAFAGMEPIRQAYAHAIAQQYRFFSYGDAMLLTRSTFNT